MSRTDETERVPTLAELRRGKTRARPRPSSAASALPGLFDAVPPESPAASEILTQAAAIESAEPEHTQTTPPAVEPPRVWSVGALVRHIRGLVERGFGNVVVEGEISNWRPAASGHCYFTLKDSAAQLSIVMFRNRVERLRFKPKDGDSVRLRGSLSVYESRGQMQLVAETMEPLGLGAMLAAVRELKETLRREGLFDRKRPLPAFPRCIGVVTSAQGAALRDIVKVCRRRHAAVRLLIYPAAVQGPNCAREVAAGLRWFSAHAERADVVIVARGGGSWEDLHGFDDERVARAIAACAVPVISGIGHATDSTIADAAADVCAPTPSAAAELVTAAQHQVEERLERLPLRLRRASRFEMLQAQQRFARLSAAMVLRRVRDGLGQRAQRLDDLAFRAEAALQASMSDRRSRLASLLQRLDRQDVRRRLVADERRESKLRTRLSRAGEALTGQRRLRAERLTSRLDALSPVRVLERGYALVYASDGRLLRDSSDTHEGERITARLARGTVSSRVTKSSEG
jgi:exodeoxyribonuclease VII large subunit